MPDSVGRLHSVVNKAATVSRKGGFTFYSFLSCRQESTAITVVIIVATQVTKAITHSQVIRKPPKIKFQQLPVEFGRQGTASQRQKQSGGLFLVSLEAAMLRTRHRIRHFQDQYSTFIQICIVNCAEMFEFFFLYGFYII